MEQVKIAELTVANIFSTGLVMVTLPFAPLSVLITPLVWYTNFKIEKWIIINYYTKPKKEIRGGKSGTIFAAFYLASVLVISLPCVYFFLMRNTFYAVDIVDDNGTYGELCTELKFATYGSRGPFISGTDVNGVDVVYNEVFSSNAFLQVVWEVFVSRSYGVWFLLFLMYFAYRFTKNTLKVEREGQQSKEKIMQNLIASLRGNLSKKEQTIKKLKTIGRESDSDSDADAPAHDVQQDDGGAEKGEGKGDEGDE
jgi:hypothetical protein